MSTVSLDQFIKELREGKRRSLAALKTVGYKESMNVLEELKLRSPLDKGTFRKNWEIRELGRTSSKSISFRLENRLFYAPWLDFGGEIGGEPWNWPSDTNPSNGGNVSNSGKLIVTNGRVWAGGKSPAGFAIGGVINPVIYYNRERQMDMANKLADAVIGAL